MAVTLFKTVQSFAQFVKNFILNGGRLLDQNTANLRAEICAGCHNNKSTSDITKTCSACNKISRFAVNKFRNMVIKDNITTSDARLLACGICGCDLKITVWVPNSALLSKEDSNAYPTFCFKKAILRDADI